VGGIWQAERESAAAAVAAADPEDLKRQQVRAARPRCPPAPPALAIRPRDPRDPTGPLPGEEMDGPRALLTLTRDPGGCGCSDGSAVARRVEVQELERQEEVRFTSLISQSFIVRASCR